MSSDGEGRGRVETRDCPGCHRKTLELYFDDGRWRKWRCVTARCGYKAHEQIPPPTQGHTQ
jgi:hypothetical protein